MTADLIGSPFRFIPQTGTVDAPVTAFADRFTTTSLAQLGDGTVVLGYNAILPGVIEFFDPTTGAETRFNEIVSDEVSRFGATFSNDTTDVTVAAAPGGGFIAAWLTEVSLNHQLEVARFDAAGVEIETFVTRTEGSNRFPDSPSLTAVGSEAYLVSLTANDTYALDRLESTGASQLAQYSPAGTAPLVAPLGDAGGIAILHEVEDGGAEPFTDAAFLEFRGSDGSLQGDPINLTVGHPGLPGSNAVALGAMADGGVVALYTTTTGNGGDRALFAEVFGPDGIRHTSVESPRAIDLGVDPGGAGLAGQAGASLDVVGTPDGGYAIVFKRTDDGSDSLANFPDTDIYLTVYDADEAPVGPPRLVNEGFTEGEQGGVDALVTADGTLLVSYFDSPTGGGDVKLQQIDLGSPTDPEPTDPEPTDPDPTGPIRGTSGPDPLIGTDGDDVILGLDGNDTLDGGGGNDHIDGGRGRDRMEGGPGDDLFLVDNAGDRVVDAVGQGFDTLRATAQVTLGAAEIERVVLEGSRALRVNGNEFATEIVGNEGSNILVGGGGGDTLTGEAGRDFFAFLTSDAPGASRILDFDDRDQIALDDRFFGLGDASVDARAVTQAQIGNALRTGSVAYNQRTGELSIDSDGRGGPGELQLVAVIEGGGPLGVDEVLLF